MSQFITILSSLTRVEIDVMIGSVSFLSSTWNDNKRPVDGVEFDESVENPLCVWWVSEVDLSDVVVFQ